MEPEEFQGTIGRYHWESEPWWPEEPSPPEGAPNVLIVVLDDVGFAQLGCFGSDIATPNIDRARGRRPPLLELPHDRAVLADAGLRAHRAQPPRHRRRTGGRPGPGFPGYDARIPKSCAFLPAMLTPHGYAAYAVGKWHLTPEEDTHLGARRDRWPLARGFERFYGYFPGETSQYVPALVHDNHLTQAGSTVRGGLPPHDRPGRQGHRGDRGPAQRRRREAVAALPRDGRVPLPPPGPCRVGRALRGPLRRRLGRLAGRGPRPAEGGRRSCPTTPSCRPGPTGCRRGTRSATSSGASTRATWRRSPDSCPTPTTRSAGCSIGSRRWATSTTRSSW